MASVCCVYKRTRHAAKGYTLSCLCPFHACSLQTLASTFTKIMQSFAWPRSVGCKNLVEYPNEMKCCRYLDQNAMSYFVQMVAQTKHSAFAVPKHGTYAAYARKQRWMHLDVLQVRTQTDCSMWQMQRYVKYKWYCNATMFCWNEMAHHLPAPPKLEENHSRSAICPFLLVLCHWRIRYRWKLLGVLSGCTSGWRKGSVPSKHFPDKLASPGKCSGSRPQV